MRRLYLAAAMAVILATAPAANAMASGPNGHGVHSGRGFHSAGFHSRHGGFRGTHAGIQGRRPGQGGGRSFVGGGYGGHLL